MAQQARIRISDLRHRVELLTKSMAPAGGSSGTGLSTTYTRVATVWASIVLLRGGRYVAGMQVEEVATHRITIRHISDPSSWNHVREGNKVYRVLSIGDPDGMRKHLEMMVEELNEAALQEST